MPNPKVIALIWCGVDCHIYPINKDYVPQIPSNRSHSRSFSCPSSIRTSFLCAWIRKRLAISRCIGSGKQSIFWASNAWAVGTFLGKARNAADNIDTRSLSNETLFKLLGVMVGQSLSYKLLSSITLHANSGMIKKSSNTNFELSTRKAGLVNMVCRWNCFGFSWEKLLPMYRMAVRTAKARTSFLLVQNRFILKPPNLKNSLI